VALTATHSVASCWPACPTDRDDSFCMLQGSTADRQSHRTLRLDRGHGVQDEDCYSFQVVANYIVGIFVGVEVASVSSGGSSRLYIRGPPSLLGISNLPPTLQYARHPFYEAQIFDSCMLAEPLMAHTSWVLQTVA
jgi:hypothetical protein